MSIYFDHVRVRVKYQYQNINVYTNISHILVHVGASAYICMCLTEEMKSCKSFIIIKRVLFFLLKERSQEAGAKVVTRMTMTHLLKSELEVK